MLPAFAVFLAGYMLSQFFRSFLAVIAPDLSAELSLSAADLGIVSGAWFAAFALAQFPVGWALDRIGPRRTITFMMLPAAIGALIFARATTTWHCVVAMALIGIGCAPIYMSALYVFGRTLRPERFALFASWLLALGTSGNLLATTPLAIAAHHLGWRGTFLALTGICLAVTGLAWVIVRDVAASSQSIPRQSALSELGSIVATRRLWPIFPLVLVSYAVVAGERGLWMGPFLADVHGLDAVARGNAALIMAIAMSLGAFAYGPLDQWLGTRKWVVVAGTAITALGFVLLGTVSGADVVCVIILLAVIGAAGMTYAVLMAHGRQFIPEHLLGRGLTFLNFLFMGGISGLQWISGRYVDAAKAAGVPAPQIYAQLHLSFAAVLIVALAIYAWSHDRKL